MLRLITTVLLFWSCSVQAMSILIPMDQHQKNHLKAYGMAFYMLQKGLEVDWLLNYRGGSFMVTWANELQSECVVRGVSFELVDDLNVNRILKEIESPSANMNVVKLERAPSIHRLHKML